jgi:hypothetical protein
VAEKRAVAVAEEGVVAAGVAGITNQRSFMFLMF